MTWESCWPAVRQAVRSSRTRHQALAKVGEVRGSTTWDALARAWRRQRDAGVEDTEAHEELGKDVEERYATITLSEEQLKASKDDRGAFLRMKDWLPELGSLPPMGLDRWQSVGRKHLVIPDTQVKPGVPIDHFRWIGRYIADKGPDVVIHLGDHWDMPSLSSYESAKRKAARGLAKKPDIDAGNRALELLEEELVKANFQPAQKVLLEGNHDGFAPEGRVGRYLAENPEDDGLITLDMFADSWTGWTRYPFLEPVEIDQVSYCHLFPFNRQGRVGPMGLRMGAASAAVQVQALMQSCTAGHKQGLDTAMQNPPMARHAFRGVIAGSCYQHDEAYLGPGNRHYRGLLVKHDVRVTNPNHYDLMEVSLEFLKRRYGGN